jgi:hypothetical protein
MATVVKDFKVKAGLIVEGANATVGGFDVLTKSEDDQDYIISLIGGSATPDATPDTVVLRDANASFAANAITANSVNIASMGTISDAGGDELAITALEGEDIRLTADDVRVDAVDDFRVNVGGDILLATSGIETGVYVGSIDTGNQVVTELTLDNHVGDNSVDGTSGNTVTDRIATAKSEAISDANSYTDSAVQGAIGDIPTTTDELTEGTTNLYYTDTRARGAVDAGDGLDYNSSTGVFSADLGNGLQFDINGQIEIDNNVVATQTDLSDDISSHSNTTSGVHGVTGDVVGTVDAQTLTNKNLGSGTTLSADIDADGNTVANLADPVNASDAATKGYVDAVAEGLHVHASVKALSDTNIALPTAPATVDGVSLSVNDRVLLTGQTAPAENGIYVVIKGDLARAADYNTAGEIQAGDFVFVTNGSTYGSTGWVQENAVTTLGTDPIEWSQFSGAGAYTAGNGLTLTGTEFAIDTDVTATKTYVDEEIDAHTELTSAHGVTGDIVGTSDTQSLTNKTLGSGTVLGADLDGTNTYKVVNLADPTSNQDAATKKYVDDEISGVNDTIDGLTTTDIAEGDNLYYTDGRVKDVLTASTQTNISITNVAGELIITAENGVADSTTDDLTEGLTNKYFTDVRAVDAVATAIADGTHENIQITYANGAISFVAENGVDDSTTDDLTEGSTNLYFTDARAVSALEAVVPNFDEIDINSVATQVAASSSGDATQTVVAYQFPHSDYRSAKFLVKVAYSTHTEVSEVLLTLDTSNNISITEYAVVGTNGSASAITADVSGSNVRLIVTPTNNGSTIKVMGTLLV